MPAPDRDARRDVDLLVPEQEAERDLAAGAPAVHDRAVAFLLLAARLGIAPECGAGPAATQPNHGHKLHVTR